MTLATAFDRSAAKRPNKIAVVWGEREYSYREVADSIRLVSSQLRVSYGVRPGDRVGVWLKNRPEFITVLFAILRAGAVVVPINNFFKSDEVNFILSDAGIDLLISEAELESHFRALTTARPALTICKVEDLGPASPNGAGNPGNSEPEECVRTESDLAVLIYTSGTTGRPKGAMLSHGNLLHNVESCRIVLQTVELDRFAVLLPMFHSYMLTVGLLLPLLVGGSIVLVKSLHPVRSVIQDILQREVTVLPAIPQFYRSMANASIPFRLPLRLCISGAAPLPVQVLQEFEAKFRIPLIEGYGLSEASPVVTKNPLDGTRKPGSIGLPIADVKVSIQDDAGNELGPHQTGEVCVRGGNVMLGYWNQPGETAKVMRDGWLLTGDIGYRDEEGYFYITDRKKDMVLVNGINVYPREIEEVLYQYPGVKEAAVVGKADVRKGEQPIAFLVPNDGAILEERAVQHFVRKRLAEYKVPRKVLLLPALPRNATGKVLKTALRDLVAGPADPTLEPSAADKVPSSVDA